MTVTYEPRVLEHLGLSNLLCKAASCTGQRGYMMEFELEFETEECPVCSGPHDPDIHHATTTIHQWLRSEIARRTDFADADSELPEPCAWATMPAVEMGLAEGA